MESEKDQFVLYVLTKLELGGAQKVCLTLLKGIAQCGYSSGLITGTDGVLLPQVQDLNNVYFIQEFKREIGFRTILLELKSLFAMYRLIKKLKKLHSNMIVHTHSTKAGFFGRWAAFFARVDVRIHTIHGFGFNDYQSWKKRAFFFIIEYITSLITTRYICVSEKDLLTGIKKIPFFAKKSLIIRAAVDWDSFYITSKRTSNIGGDLVIGTVSCLKPQKNVIDLLQAFKLVLDKISPASFQRLFLHIIGDGILRDDLELFVHKNNLTNHVVFLGWQSDVSKWMKEWDIFAMSSLWEGLPCAAVEARLCRLPVVAYDVGGISDIILNGKNGCLIKPGDWQSLAEQLVLLIKNKALRTRMINHDEKLDDFKHSSMVREHLILYRTLQARFL